MSVGDDAVDGANFEGRSRETEWGDTCDDAKETESDGSAGVDRGSRTSCEVNPVESVMMMDNA